MRLCQRARAFTGRAASDAQFMVTYDALTRRLLIRAENVSEQHAHLTLKQTGNNNEQWEVVIVDDTSRNGTFLLPAATKRKLRVMPGKECPVRPGARILFADVKLAVQDVSMQAPRAVATGGGEGASPSDGDSATGRGHGANSGGDSGDVEAGGESSGVEADESGGVEAGGSADSGVASTATAPIPVASASAAIPAATASATAGTASAAAGTASTLTHVRQVHRAGAGRASGLGAVWWRGDLENRLSNTLDCSRRNRYSPLHYLTTAAVVAAARTRWPYSTSVDG